MPQYYCPICGAPLFGEGETWLAEHVLLTTGVQTENGVVFDKCLPARHRSDGYHHVLSAELSPETERTVLRFTSQVHGGEVTANNLIYDLLPSKTQVTVNRVTHDFTKPRKGSPLYISVHEQCLRLADHFIEYTSTSARESFAEGIVSSMMLWKTLQHRMPGQVMHTCWLFGEPHSYFGGDGCRNSYYEAGDDPEFAELSEEDPMSNCDLTDAILQNLEPMVHISDPADMVEKVSRDEALRNGLPGPRKFEDMDLVCEYTRDRNWWCDALLDKKKFPWIWDLDQSKVNIKRNAGRWNWEFLVRKVSQTSIHQHPPDNDFLTLPLSLRNRRRIWRLLDLARLDDVAKARLRRKDVAQAQRRGGLPQGFPLLQCSLTHPPPGFSPGFIPRPRVLPPEEQAAPNYGFPPDYDFSTHVNRD